MRDIPDHDRPRERLLASGARALSEAELLAILLGTGARGASTVDVARRLLARFGGLTGLSRARPEEMAREPGVGSAKAARLSAHFELAGRDDAGRTGTRLLTSADIASVAHPLLARERTERLVVLVADGGSRLVHSEVVSLGGATASAVPVREILATVLRLDGVAFALAHNHPGGDPTPSSADVATTTAIRDAAAHVGLRFLDHIVVTDATWRSVSASR